MIVSVFLFLGLYFFYFLTLIAMYPGYVEKVWNLKVISGILIFGIPLEELLFAFSFGFLWSSIYEHVTWRTQKNKKVDLLQHIFLSGLNVIFPHVLYYCFMNKKEGEKA